MHTSSSIPIHVSISVREAFAAHKAVVALESTVITHGLPYPQNLATLQDLEDTIRTSGAVPATIIVWKGTAHVGIEDDILTELADHGSHELHKLGMRDLPLAFAKNLSGGTTVSATMLLSSIAGIEVFATGGIGGVHRDWQSHPDVSSDLTALASIPVIVVSAGCKAILDISATLEYLESLAVPVLGWHTSEFPSFYSRGSGLRIDSVDSLADVASFWQHHLSLHSRPSGVLIANPIPEEAEIPFEHIKPHIDAAIREASESNILGKALTPFLLDKLAHATKGDSVRANLALLKNNALLAAKLATALKE
jgi:pseudouridine-5'-phosphate glycosidase